MDALHQCLQTVNPLPSKKVIRIESRGPSYPVFVYSGRVHIACGAALPMVKLGSMARALF
jgi:hypothetical protein